MAHGADDPQMIADDPQMILGLCRSSEGRRLP
jgi:hypothetical protein